MTLKQGLLSSASITAQQVSLGHWLWRQRESQDHK